VKRLLASILAIISLTVTPVSFGSSDELPPPVIFVHGIGDSSVAWINTGPAVSSLYDGYFSNRYHPFFRAGSGIGSSRFDQDFEDNERNSCVYVTFSDHFASPEAQVPELERVIEETRDEVWSYFRDNFRSKDEIKVCLVCHSMGGLVGRSYLAKHRADHHVDTIVLIAAPNLGSTGLIFNWVPAGLMAGGIGAALVTANPWLLGFTAAGLGWDVISRVRGVNLLSDAVRDMKPGSDYLKRLSDSPVPEDVRYVSIVSATDSFPHSVANQVLFYEGGDGAIYVDSQSLSKKSVPNFEFIDYREYMIDAPHYEEPDRALKEIITSLRRN